MDHSKLKGQLTCCDKLQLSKYRFRCRSAIPGEAQNKGEEAHAKTRDRRNEMQDKCSQGGQRDECQTSGRFPNVQLMSVPYHTPKNTLGSPKIWRVLEISKIHLPTVLSRLRAQPALLQEPRECQKLPSAPAQLEAFHQLRHENVKHHGKSWEFHRGFICPIQEKTRHSLSAKDQFRAQSIHYGFLKVLTWATDIFTKVMCGLVNLPGAANLYNS